MQYEPSAEASKIECFLFNQDQEISCNPLHPCDYHVGSEYRAAFRTYQKRKATRRYVATAIASQRLNVSQSSLSLEHEPSGKPQIEGFPAISISLSGSEQIAAFAMSYSQPLGVDVQKLIDFEMMSDVAEHFYSDIEQRSVSCLMSELEISRFCANTILWTLKESYVKSIGQGLSKFSSFSIVYSSGNAYIRQHHPSNNGTLDFVSYLVGDDAVLSVAMLKGADHHVNYFGDLTQSPGRWPLQRSLKRLF